jgi:hypothetical protein
MGAVSISRRRFVTAGAMGTIGALLAPETVFADDGQPELLRWDLINIKNGVILSGGTDFGRDAKTGDTVSVTGSGEAQPNERRATGGGTFVHRRANGTVAAQGVFFVTGFISFVKPGGSLVGISITDGIGRLDQTGGGKLSLNIRGILDGGGTVDAVLGVDCTLPGGASGITEGITLTVPAFDLHFAHHGGSTLFHVLAD